jgi:hypothetical protein
MLTYNATSPNIKLVEDAGFAAPRLPNLTVFEPGSVKRLVLVSEEVNRVLDGTEAPVDLAIVQAQRVVSRFMLGLYIPVARGMNDKKALLKQMEHVPELWTICLRNQAPGVRIIGRFVEHDFFVGLKAPHRNQLVASFQPALDMWNQKLSHVPFVQSPNLDDYLFDKEMYHEL